jgi:hypothetical protein
MLSGCAEMKAGDPASSVLVEVIMKRLVIGVGAALAAALLAAGCSQPKRGAAATAATTTSPTTVQAVVEVLRGKAIMVEHVRMNTGAHQQFGTREDADATIGGEAVNIVTFPTNPSADRWVPLPPKLAGGFYVIGAGWAILTKSQALAQRIAAATGAMVR